MKIEILGSTKQGYIMPKEEAIDYSGKSAGICYMPDDLNTLWEEAIEKTQKRANMTLKSGHHSVFDHPTYNLGLIEIPKILAMILNNEGMYTTSEKSARYTRMKVSEKEEKLYEKWIHLFKKAILDKYPDIAEKQAIKLSQENARYLISVFTPSTTMEYTVSFRQLNYIIHWFKDFIETAEDNEFNLKLKPVLNDFVNLISDLYVDELNTNSKDRTISLFNERTRKREFGETYCTTYEGTFAQLAQAQRHRTLRYSMCMLKEPKFFVPYIIRNTPMEKEWLEDISSISYLFPQGMLISINERGTVEDFVLKCKERLCGYAQLEIMLQTKETLDKYLSYTKIYNQDVYNYLIPYSHGLRCSFPGFKCDSPCIWGGAKAMKRLI